MKLEIKAVPCIEHSVHSHRISLTMSNWWNGDGQGFLQFFSCFVINVIPDRQSCQIETCDRQAVQHLFSWPNHYLSSNKHEPSILTIETWCCQFELWCFSCFAQESVCSEVKCCTVYQSHILRCLLRFAYGQIYPWNDRHSLPALSITFDIVKVE